MKLLYFIYFLNSGFFYIEDSSQAIHYPQPGSTVCIIIHTCSAHSTHNSVPPLVKYVVYLKSIFWLLHLYSIMPVYIAVFFFCIVQSVMFVWVDSGGDYRVDYRDALSPFPAASSLPSIYYYLPYPFPPLCGLVLITCLHVCMSIFLILLLI